MDRQRSARERPGVRARAPRDRARQAEPVLERRSRLTPPDALAWSSRRVVEERMHDGQAVDRAHRFAVPATQRLAIRAVHRLRFLRIADAALRARLLAAWGELVQAAHSPLD